MVDRPLSLYCLLLPSQKMIHRLLTTAVRGLSANYRDVIYYRVKGGERLCRTPFAVFQERESGKLSPKARAAMSPEALRKQFEALSGKKRATYAAAARKNRCEIDLRRKAFKQASLSGFSHFIKTTRQWTDLGRRAKEKCCAETEKIRQAAKVERDKMVEMYYSGNAVKH
ncbi:hypothetical protein XU18_0864 [Perkinsela sp. CCAP 1560/4]|nr:hypothetical protein XU18_0864 [Perkinsela sp. CCAP 1560/4]|eukprot:KNH08667.1 hypothetical protein XU18_0864 [Perkinsela sp. CCAP 1560/4]